jgi:hypothetical protein
LLLEICTSGTEQYGAYPEEPGKAFVTTQKLYLVMQHEFVHVRLNALGYIGENHYHESIAYKVSSDQAKQWGMADYGSLYSTEAIKHSGYVNFTPSYTPTFYIRKFHPVW